MCARSAGFGMQQQTFAVAAGTVAAAVFTAVLFAIPAVIPLEVLRRRVDEMFSIYVFGNPLKNLRLFGGFVGGIVAGYLSEDRWDVSAPSGMKAGVYGLLLLYGLLVAGNIANAVLVDGIFPPPLIAILFVPLGIVVLFVPINLVGGLAGGMVGMGLQRIGR